MWVPSVLDVSWVGADVRLLAVGTVGIVGAGPAGLFAANVLVRAGIDCTIFERLDEGGVRARARAGLMDWPMGCSSGERPWELVSSAVMEKGTSSTTAR